MARTVTQYGNSAKVLVTHLQTQLPFTAAFITKVYESLNQSTAIHTSVLSTRKGYYNQNQKPIIRKMDPSNQPPDAWNSSEKSGMLQPTSPPPAYQDNPAGYPTSFPSQPVSQGPYAQGPYPGQSVVTVQPAVFVTAVPLANPQPDYMCYSIFTMLCCCCPLGIAALVFSCSTQNANYSGQQALAENNSKTAHTLNHVGVAVGLVFIVLIIILQIVLNTR